MRVVSLLPRHGNRRGAGGAGRLSASPMSVTIRRSPHAPRVTRTHSTRRSAPARSTARWRRRSVRRLPVQLDLGFLRASPRSHHRQSLCDVCAIGATELERAVRPWAAAIRRDPARARSGRVFADMQRVGEALDLADEADELVAGLRYRLRKLRASLYASTPQCSGFGMARSSLRRRPWVPELVAAAAGRTSATAPGSARRRARGGAGALAPTWSSSRVAGFDVAGRRGSTKA